MRKVRKMFTLNKNNSVKGQIQSVLWCSIYEDTDRG